MGSAQGADTLNAVVRNAGGVVTQSRPLCLYPRVAAYKGRGDPMSAASFVCRKRDHDDHDD